MHVILPVCNNMSNTTGATCGAGSAYPFRAHVITPSFGGYRVAYSFVFYVVSCVLLFVFFIFSHGIVSFFSI